VTSIEWLEPPAFAAARVEWLPGRPDAALGPAGARAREEHRALFPERAGELSLGTARLRCRAGAAELELSVPTAALRVRPLPAEGRPPDFSGVVGELSIERRADPTRIALGSSLRVALRLRGPGNLWDAPDPLPEDALSGAAELFRLSPEQELQRGERLLASVLFRYDLVPRSPGPLLLPALRIPYFDPRTGRYEAAQAPALRVEVLAK
jgi:hypothetical protein